MQPIFWSTFAALLLAGFLVLRLRRGAGLYSLLSLAFFLGAVLSLISFFSLYIYALPPHHCPFCMLHQE